MYLVFHRLSVNIGVHCTSLAQPLQGSVLLCFLLHIEAVYVLHFVLSEYVEISQTDSGLQMWNCLCRSKQLTVGFSSPIQYRFLTLCITGMRAR